MTDAERVNFDSYRRTQFPLSGLSVPDLVAALEALPASAQVIQLDTRRDGWQGQRALWEECEGWVVCGSVVPSITKLPENKGHFVDGTELASMIAP